jgi:hypothetical protein
LPPGTSASRRSTGPRAGGPARTIEAVDEPGRVLATFDPGDVTAEELQARFG